MPGAIGVARDPVAALVGRTSTSSKMPWYAPVNMTILSRPETVRATRIAAVTASEPVLQNAARSMPIISQTSFATSPASGVCGPISMPASSCALTASRMKSGLCPKKIMPKPLVRSTYSLPSTSHRLRAG